MRTRARRSRGGVSVQFSERTWTSRTRLIRPLLAGVRRAQWRHALSTCARISALRALAVAPPRSLEQLLVLGDVRLLPVGLRAPACKEAPADVGDPERVEDPGQGVVARRAGERRVERAAGVVGGGGACARIRSPATARRSASRSASFRRSAARRAIPGSSEQARLEPLEHPLEAGVRDEEAAVHLEHDEAVACQPPERLPHGAARDPERLRQLRLADASAGLEPPVDDHARAARRRRARRRSGRGAGRTPSRSRGGTCLVTHSHES